MRINCVLLCTAFGAAGLYGDTNVVRLPLHFEPTANGSTFVGRAGGVSLRLTPTTAEIHGGTMQLVRGSGAAQAQPEDPLNGYTNYLMAGDPAKWRIHVRNYARIRYRNVYPGIDVVYYGSDRQLEFDFILKPGANPKDIQLRLSSTDLQIRLPRIYQAGHEITGRAVRRGNRVTFDVADYDHSKTLVIDPVLSYAAVFGGGGQDEGRAIAVDSTGAAYVVGTAYDSNFPVVNGSNVQSGSFIAKVNPAGDGLIYSTYLPFAVGFLVNGGGPSNTAIDPSGNVYFASPNFSAVIASAPNGSPIPVLGPPPLGPCTVNGPPMLYVAKLKSDGASVVYSGCVPGSIPGGPGVVAADASGNAYVTGWAQSSDFPLVNPLPNSPLVASGPARPFLLKLAPDGKLLYSTLFGGPGGNTIEAVTADPAGNIYVAGQTSAPDFPIKNAILPRPPSFNSPFVTKIKADGSDYVYSTYLGGSNNDVILAIAADASGKAYLAGSTSSGDFPVTPNALDKKFDGTFLFKSTDGAKTWSRADSGLPSTASSLQVDPNQPSTIYAVSGGSVFKSVDRGASWAGTAAAAVSSLWIDPVDSALFIGTTHGDLVRSRDGGTTFVPLAAAPGGNLNAIAFDPTNGSVIYARWGGHGATDGVYKSIDGGDTWKATGLSGAMTGSGALAIDPANPSFLYAEARNRGLVKSLDGGDTWTNLGGDVGQIIVDSNSTLYSTAGTVVHVLPLHGSTIDKIAPGPVGTLLIDPGNSSIWYATIYGATGQAIYRTTDSGDTWQQVTSGLPSPVNATSFVLDPSAPQTLYLGSLPNTDGFFAKISSDGTSLQYSTYLGGSGVDATTAIAIDTAGNSYLAGTTNSTDFPQQAAFRQSGSGFAAMFDATNKLVWSSLLGGAAPTAAAAGLKGELFLTGSASSSTFSTQGALGPFVSGQVFRTTNAGTSWTGNLVASNPQLQVSAVAVDPKNPSHVFALADRLYGSSDSGQTWSQLGSPLSPPYISAGYGGFVKLNIDPLNPANLYVAISTCAVSSGVIVGCGISKSTDGGLTWTLNQVVAPPPNQPQIFVVDVAIAPKTTSTLYAAVQQQPQPQVATTTGGIYKSTDAGITWNITGLVSNTVAVAVDPLNSSIVYASIGPTSLDPRTGLSNSLGLFKSSDGGATWTAINTGLPSGWFAVNLTADPSVPQRIYAVGYSTTGIYRSDDGGNHWTALGAGLPNAPITAIALDPTSSGTVYVAPVAGGLYRSVNAGASWALMQGLRVPIVNSIAVDPSNSSRIYAGTQPNPADAFVMKIVP